MLKFNSGCKLHWFGLLFLIINSNFIYSQSLFKNNPNIIIILADDLGYADVGFNGSKDIPTPNIDKIAKGGVTFTRGYVSYAVCGPSRAGLITGRYQDKFGFAKNPLLAPNDASMGLPLTEQTIANYLKQQNYTTTAIGKWHLGAHQTLRPNKRGFDEFYGFLSGGHRYFPEELTLQDLSEIKSQFDGYKTKLLRNNSRVEETEYLTDAFSREAVSFVKRKGNNPFFMYLAYNAPHSPLQATDKYLDRFKDIKDPKRRTYAAMVSAMDDGIGLLLNQLEQQNLTNNTLIFFLSDNGGPTNDNVSNNSPLRGFKGDFFEGGIRVPFAMKWPAQITANTIYNKPVISLDIFATIAGYLGGKTKSELDGQDLLPFLKSDNNKYPHEFLYWRNFEKNKFAIIQHDFKLIEEQDNQKFLFNLGQDVKETNNLIQTNITKLDFLKKELWNWRKLLQAPKFDGLLDDDIYTKSHPDRYQITIHK
jgi:arylsulfatase A-like enzyme